jgi:hypothetical protein
VKQLLTTIPPEKILGNTEELTVAVGFDDGDWVEIGMLSRKGLKLVPCLISDNP